MAAAIAQTIAVVDKSGRVVSTSKQLKSVFMEAKFAYQERKAEIVAERRAKATSKQGKDVRRAVTDLRDEDHRSERSSTSRRRHSHRHQGSERRQRPDDLARHHSRSSLGSPRERDSYHPPHSPGSSHFRSPRNETNASRQSRSAPTSPIVANDPNRRSLDLVRRRTDMDLARLSQSRHPVRSMSTTAVDMDLAYGDYHPSSIAPFPRGADEKQLLTLVDRVKLILDEANCAQHSVKAMIENLQKNPDAMAAVALTLAEISNIASKMAPGVLTALKGSAPAVFSLLASPQFLIAAGVGIGVTVVMFGGYKIIKKIKAKNAAEKDAASTDEMMEIDGGEVQRINKWRRGIVAPGDADGTGSEIASVGTSVDGEFITPLAASMRGMETRESLTSARLSGMERKKREKRENKDTKKENKMEETKKKKSKQESRKGTGEAGSESSTKSEKTGAGEEWRKALVKVKKPSPLRRLLA